MRRLCIALIFLAVALLAMAAAAQNIPPGVAIPVRINSSLSSGTAHVGQTFDGVIARDVVVNGSTLVKAGTPVEGKVSSVTPSGRLSKPGRISLRLTSIGGHQVDTLPVSRRGKGHGKSNAVKIGGGTAAGAVIGGLAGGGKGAAIGAGAGAAAGTGAAAVTGKKEAVIPSEAIIRFYMSGTTAASTHHKRR
jgi:hypothetical protein